MDPRTAGTTCWYDASHPRGVIRGAGRDVATLTDLSGNARDISQATASLRPQWHPQLFGTNRPGIRFDGTDDWLGDGPRMNLLCTSTAYTVLCVARLRSTSTNNASADNNECLISNLGGYLGLYSKTGIVGWYHYDGGIKSTGNAWSYGPNTLCLSLTVLSGGTMTSTFFAPNVSTTSNAAAGANGFDNSVTLRLGRASSIAYYSHAELAELAFFNVALSANAQNGLLRYAFAKWMQ